MKILFCNYEYPPVGGGGGVINALIAEELAKRHDVTVLTSQCLGQPKESVAKGVNVIRIPALFRKEQGAANFVSLFSYVVLGLFFGNRYLKGRKFDIINTHFVLPTGPVGYVLAKRQGVANILSVHGGDLYDPSKSMSPHKHWYFRAVINFLLRAASRVVAQSSDTKSNVSIFYSKDIAVDIIPLAIERPLMGFSASRQDYGIAENEIVLVTVGRLVVRKQVDKLLHVISKLNYKDKLVRLFVIGSGPLESELKHKAKALEISNQVEFFGYIDEVKKNEIVSLSDIFVSTSEHEGFGLVFLEAMAYGVPVICFDKGGQVDFLENDKTGYVVPINDIDGFVRRLDEVLENPELLDKMKKYCIHIMEEYYIEKCAESYEKLFIQYSKNSSSDNCKNLN